MPCPGKAGLHAKHEKIWFHVFWKSVLRWNKTGTEVQIKFLLWACVMPLLVETFRLNAKKVYGRKLLCTCTIRNFTYTWQKANCYSIFPAINNFISPVPWSNPWLDILLLPFFFFLMENYVGHVLSIVSKKFLCWYVVSCAIE